MTTAVTHLDKFYWPVEFDDGDQIIVQYYDGTWNTAGTIDLTGARNMSIDASGWYQWLATRVQSALADFGTATVTISYCGSLTSELKRLDYLTKLNIVHSDSTQVRLVQSASGVNARFGYSGNSWETDVNGDLITDSSPDGVLMFPARYFIDMRKVEVVEAASSVVGANKPLVVTHNTLQERTHAYRALPGEYVRIGAIAIQYLSTQHEEYGTLQHMLRASREGKTLFYVEMDSQGVDGDSSPCFIVEPRPHNISDFWQDRSFDFGAERYDISFKTREI